MKARILPGPFVGDVRLTEGVGIYRAGIKKRLPSYYIWGRGVEPTHHRPH